MPVSAYAPHEAKVAAREHLRGIITAPTMPVDERGQIDEPGLRHDVRHCLDVIESSGLYIHGFYGHFWLLSTEQRMRAIEIVVDEARGAVPIICRCAHPSPAETIKLAQHAQEAGADFISLLPPPFGGAHKDVLFGYFRMVAREIDLGISIFNTGQNGYVISPQAMAELAEIPNVCALKNGQPMAHTIQVREHAGDEILVVDPDEENFLVNALEFGQQAIYTGTNMMFDSAAHRPMKAYVDAALAGEKQEAVRLHYEMDELRRLHRHWVLSDWHRTGLCPIATVKRWSSLMGMTGGPVPEPLPGIDEDAAERLRKDLIACGALEDRVG